MAFFRCFLSYQHKDSICLQSEWSFAIKAETPFFDF